MRLQFCILFLVFAGLAHAGNFVVDKTQSELAADMHASPSHDFTSIAKDYVCDIEIDPETMTIKKAFCSFKFADLDSGKESRDKKMCKWMNIEQHPEASYTMKEIASNNEPDSYLAKGIFTMHGKSVPLEVKVHIERKADTIVITGDTELDHRDWGLEIVRLLFFSVEPTLKPRFRLVGQVK